MIGGELVRAREHRLYRELLHAMQSARSRLAVAIAAENKTTPRERWRHYLETEDRMRRCVKEIRRHSSRGGGRQYDWLQALDLLRQPLPTTDRESRGEAHILCQRMYEVLAIIENHAPLVANEKAGNVE